MWALLKSDVVVALIPADQQQGAAKVAAEGVFADAYADGTGAQIDWIRQPNGTYLPPPPVIRTLLSREEFFSRFTDEEHGALLRLARADTAIGEKVAGFLRWLEILGGVDVTSDRVIQGFDFFVTQGWLTSTRRDELLAPIEE